MESVSVSLPARQEAADYRRSTDGTDDDDDDGLDLLSWFHNIVYISAAL